MNSRRAPGVRPALSPAVDAYPFRRPGALLVPASAALYCLLLTSCSLEHAPVIQAGSEVAIEQRDLLFTALGLMLVVLVPVWIMAAWFPWKYRAGNTSADYRPEWSSAPRLEAVLWLVPAGLVTVLGSLVWIYTHRLDPYRPVAGTAPILSVHAVALDWKWVFVYPQAGIATVNELVLPTGRPVEMRITADTVMNSFFIPGLAGQIYAMAGMETRLNFSALAPRRLTGRNMQYSGSFFPEQTFTVTIAEPADYEAWLTGARAAPNALDGPAYAALAARRAPAPALVYSSVERDLFERVLNKYAHGTTAHPVRR